MSSETLSTGFLVKLVHTFLPIKEYKSRERTETSLMTVKSIKMKVGQARLYLTELQSISELIQIFKTITSLTISKQRGVGQQQLLLKAKTKMNTSTPARSAKLMASQSTYLSKYLLTFGKFRPNPRFSSKSEIFVLIRDFRLTPRFRLYPRY